jgi:methyl-accepting chemotaxis protein
MDTVDQAVRTIEEATNLAGRSGDALQAIVSLVDRASDQVRSIASAADEQSAASEEINRSIEDIHRVAGETAGAMRQSAQAVSEMVAQTQTLQHIIKEMRTQG